MWVWEKGGLITTAKSHGTHFDEVWAINAVASVIYHDRVFMMDPASRFLDSDDAILNNIEKVEF